MQKFVGKYKKWFFKNNSEHRNSIENIKIRYLTVRCFSISELKINSTWSLCWIESDTGSHHCCMLSITNRSVGSNMPLELERNTPLYVWRRQKYLEVSAVMYSKLRWKKKKFACTLFLCNNLLIKMVREKMNFWNLRTNVKENKHPLTLDDVVDSVWWHCINPIGK